MTAQLKCKEITYNKVETKIQKIQKSVRDMGDIVLKSNSCMLEKRMRQKAENFPKLMKDIKPEIQDAQ